MTCNLIFPIRKGDNVTECLFKTKKFIYDKASEYLMENVM